MKKFLLTLSLIVLFTSGCASSEEKTVNDDKPAISTETPSKVASATTNNYPKISELNLIINSTPAKYTYNNFVNDLDQLQKAYGTMIQVNKLCDTIDGRGVYDVVLGDPQGDNQILIFGAMHAREYITAQVVMRQLCDAIDALNNPQMTYNGMSINELLQGVTLHFVPINNPDGVTISQLGANALQNPNVRSNVSAMMNGSYEQWKSNANGVDLNRNFDAGWQEFVGSGRPSSDRYKGTSPGSEPEAAALIKLTQDCKFKRTISYHTVGALIYWYYKQEGTVLEESKKFARRISNETGYPLDSDYTAVDAAGYKDWAVYKMGIPSLTIEVGDESNSWVDNPVPIKYWNGIWQRNKNVVYATVYNLKYEK